LGSRTVGSQVVGNICRRSIVTSGGNKLLRYECDTTTSVGVGGKNSRNILSFREWIISIFFDVVTEIVGSSIVVNGI